MEYKITLEMRGMQTSFITDDKEKIIDAFEKKNILICNKPDGNLFAVRMGDYSYMAISTRRRWKNE